MLERSVDPVFARPDPWVSDSYAAWEFDWDGEVRYRSALRHHPLPIDEWADRVLVWRPDVVGFTVHFPSLGSTLELAQAVRRRDESVLVVLGGPHVAEA